MNNEIKQHLTQIAQREVPTGYQKTKVGIVPVEWEVVSVKNAVQICDTERLPISGEERLKQIGNYPYYGPTQIQGYIDTYKSDKDAILIGEDGDHFLKFATKPMTLHVSGKFTVNNHAHIIRESKICTLKWFYHSFLHRSLLSYITRQGASRYKLSKASLETVVFLLPPLTEQEKIVQILSTQDKVIQLKEKLIEQKKQQKKYLMQQLLTGKNRLDGFCGEWKKKKLGQICQVQGGYAFKSDEYVKEGTNIIRISNIQDKEIDIKKTIKTNEIIGDSAYYVTNGDILIAMSGATTGKVGVYTLHFTSYLNQRVGKVVMIDTSFRYDFLKHWFFTNDYSNNLRNLLATGAQPNISSADLQSMQIYLPEDKKEQEAIAKILTTADTELQLLQKDLNQEKLKKKSLRQLLLTGILRVKS